MNLSILWKPLRCSRCGKLFDKREINEASHLFVAGLFLTGTLPEEIFCGKCSRENEAEEKKVETKNE